MGEDVSGGVWNRSAFEAVMWEVVRPWLDAALVSLDRWEECASFWWVWSRVCVTLEVGYVHRPLSEGELRMVWRALVEAGYPGYEQAGSYGGMEVSYVC